MSNEKLKTTTTKKVLVEAAKTKGKTSVTPGQRYQMISEAAYFRAEKRGLVGGDVAKDWLEAEAEIDIILEQQLKSGKEDRITKKAFQKKLETQLKKWDAKFDKLQVKAKKAKSEIRADIEKQIESLAGRRAVAHAEMLELGQRTEETWEDLRTGAEKTWGEMHEALDRFVARFK